HAHPQGGMALARGLLQPPKPGRRSFEGAPHAAGPGVPLAGAGDRDTDVLQKSRTGEPGPRRRPFLVAERAGGRQVTAEVALLAKDVHHAEDVLAHEDFATGHADLEAVFVGEGAPEQVERQFLPPLALDVQERADVTELAVQVAPHRGFVDDAGWKAAGTAV